VIHLLLDFGAQKAVANHCVLLPASMAKHGWLHFGDMAIFLLLNGWLLWKLAVFVARQRRVQPEVMQLLFPLAMLLPTSYGAAHMRYLIPIILLLLLMAFDLRTHKANTFA